MGALPAQSWFRTASAGVYAAVCSLVAGLIGACPRGFMLLSAGAMGSGRGRSPFTPGFGLHPPYLAGRAELVDTVAADLADGPGPRYHTIVLGPRGTGKTVLISDIAEHARQEFRAVTVRWAAGDADRPLTTALTEAIPSVEHELRSKLQRRFQGEIGVQTGIPGVLSAKATAGVDPAPRPTNLSTVGLISYMGRLAAQRHRMIVLVVDELQAAEPGELASLGTAIQEVSNIDRLPVALLAAGLPNTPSRLSEIGTTRKSVGFLERLDYTMVSNLSRTDTEEAFVVPLKNADWEITDQALSIVTDGARGYPFAIQLIGDAAWRSASTIGIIDASTAEHAVKSAHARMERSIYQQRWNRLSPTDRQYVQIAARMHARGEPIETSRISREMYGTTTGASQNRDRVIKIHHLVVPCGRGQLQFAIPGFSEWVNRQRLDTRAVPHLGMHHYQEPFR